MKKEKLLEMGVHLAVGILSNPVFAGRIFNWPFEVEQTVRDCTEVVGRMSESMCIEIEDEVAE